MTNRIAIVCNDTVPGTGVPNGANGLRAFGLYEGLRQNGVKADIVVLGSVIHSRFDRWNDSSLSIPKYLRILPKDNFNSVLNRDYTTVIAINWTSIEGFKKSKDVQFVYDFFSSTQVEHSFFLSEDHLKINLQKKLEIVSQADCYISNGHGRSTYGSTFLEEHEIANQPHIQSVRLALPWMQFFKDNSSTDLAIFSGGYAQTWVESFDLEELKFISQETGVLIHLIGFGQPLHSQLAAKEVSRDASLHVHDISSFFKFAELNGRCDLAFDIFKRNKERIISYSTRSISSICTGCPVIHADFTEIGGMIKETGAGWTFSDYSVEEIIVLLKELRQNPQKIIAAKSRAKVFWEKYCNPKIEAKALLETIMP